jgi:hypothetical protein
LPFSIIFCNLPHMQEHISVYVLVR